MVSVLFKTTEELVIRVKLVERLSPYRDYESSLKTHPKRYIQIINTDNPKHTYSNDIR